MPTSHRLQHLGGEGKLAGISVMEAPDWPSVPPLEPKQGVVHFKLLLTTAALFNESGTCWLPPGLSPVNDNGVTLWRGDLRASKGVTVAGVTLVSACVGKPVKIGGWDIASNKPRPLTGHIPAGSVYFCRAQASEIENIKQLHGAKLGLRTEYGFGHVLIGNW